MADKDYLQEVFKYIDLPKEHIDFIMSKLYKYKDDEVIKIITNVIKTNAESFSNLTEMFAETGLNLSSYEMPLMLPSPADPLALRVYPHIILNNPSSEVCKDVSPLSCTELLKSFLIEYDADILDERRKQKWQPLERASKLLNEHLDMPTARAITRYLSTGLKDNQIRDVAARIDEFRKPMELLYADKPDDFIDMYTGGPGSCMSNDTAQGHEAWEFLLKQGACPTSWYAYYPHSRGAYIKKNGRVVGRTILLQDTLLHIWYYTRIYTATPEYNKKFIANLQAAGFHPYPGGSPYGRHNVPNGFSMVIPGYQKNGPVYAAPWPYMDAMTDQWSVVYNPTTHEFTFTHGSNDRNKMMVNNRGGHIVSTDYTTVECTACGKRMKNMELLQVKEADAIFCSDDCAIGDGFVKVLSGNGKPHYQKPDVHLVDVLGEPVLKFSTVRAAADNSYFPFMEEIGIEIEEGTEATATPSGPFKHGATQTRSVTYLDGMHSIKELKMNKVPMEVKKQKNVEFIDEALLYAEGEAVARAPF